MASKPTFKSRSKIKRLPLRKNQAREYRQNLELQILPEDTASGRQIIAVLMDKDFNKERKEIFLLIKPEHFPDESHRELYISALNVQNAGNFPEFTLIGKDISRRFSGKIATDLIMKLSEIKELEEIYVQNVSEYIDGFRDAYIRRESYKSLHAAFKKIGEPGITTGEILEDLRLRIEDISKKRGPVSSDLFFSQQELVEKFKAVRWLIEGLIEADTFYFIFGDSGTFKTFVTIDQGLCIAAGIDYHGHEVKQGVVFYVPAEGQSGIIRRITAWCAKHNLDYRKIPFFVSKQPASLSDRKNIDELKLEIERMSAEHGEPALIIFDTLGRNFGEGDENKTEDMLRVIRNLDAFRTVGVTVALVHHVGHGHKERAKGSIALPQSVDASYKTTLLQSGEILLTCEKAKDGPRAAPLLFSKETIYLEINCIKTDSLVLNLEIEGPELYSLFKPIDGKKKTGSPKRDAAIELLSSMYEQYEHNLEKSGLSDSHPNVSLFDWFKECARHSIYANPKSAKRGLMPLVEKKIVQTDQTETFVYTTVLFHKYGIGVEDSC